VAQFSTGVDSDLGLILLQQIGRLYVLVERAGLKLADPDADQLPGDIVPLRQPVQRLPRDELLSNLPLERGAV